jgi:hypothetical protein
LELFTLLSAKDWSDYKPELSEFAKQLLADRDPFKAMNLITSETRAWRGTVGRRGITQFFCMGYAATDIETQPGGFTIFMFRPKNAAQPLSQAALKQSLRHLLGDTKVDDDTVLYFAQNDFYLPDSIDRLEVQLQTCIQFLDLITATKGIASQKATRMDYAFSVTTDKPSKPSKPKTIDSASRSPTYLVASSKASSTSSHGTGQTRLQSERPSVDSKTYKRTM